MVKPMGVAASERDLAVVREGLTRWLRAHHGDERLTVAPLTRPAAGLSSDTLFVDVSSGESLVARLPPAGGGIFPTYDLAMQARLQTELPAAGIPTVVPVAYEEDEAWVGSPFLLMPRVPGEVLVDNPPYARTGWLHDAGEDAQRRLYEGFLDQLAAIHAVTTVQPAPAEGARLDWWRDYLDWAGGGSPEPALVAVVAWLDAHRPEPQPAAGMLWGDVRLGNVIFGENLRPAAILDWEMATAGPAEVDLGWFFAMREMMVAPGRVELPGFLDKAASVGRYERALGRQIRDLEWYEVFALLRSTAILCRMQGMLIAQGQTDHWLVGFDPVPPRLRQLA